MLRTYLVVWDIEKVFVDCKGRSVPDRSCEVSDRIRNYLSGIVEIMKRDMAAEGEIEGTPGKQLTLHRSYIVLSYLVNTEDIICD